MSAPISPVIPLISALIGAIAGGLFQAIIRIWDRWHERKTTFVAIASEVDAICVLIRNQRYLESVQEIVAAHGSGTWRGESVIVDVRSDYFQVFGALAPRLGTLKPADARAIVRFYSLCKSAVDGMRPDGPIAKQGTPHERLSAAHNLVLVFQAILWIGAQIVRRAGFLSDPPDTGSAAQKA